MTRIITAVLAVCLATPAMAETLSPLPMPPPEFDHEYAGPMFVEHVSKEMMLQLCPRTIFDRTYRVVPVTLGCTRLIPMSGVAQPRGALCLIIVAEDEILKDMGFRPDEVFRHERAHCNNWPQSHPSARFSD